MGIQTKQTIIDAAFAMFALDGYEAVTMRKLAAASGVALSSIYHFFTDKDILLKQIYLENNANLGQARALLPDRPTAKEMLHDRIAFQFEHIDQVMFVLKYYMHFRSHFKQNDTGFLPAKGYLHMDEVIEKGIATGEYQTDNPVRDAKIMTHAINGFLIEYFPQPPTGQEREALISDIVHFLSRSIERKEV